MIKAKYWFMQLEALKYLLDISDAISDIDEFFINVLAKTKQPIVDGLIIEINIEKQFINKKSYWVFAQ